MITYSLSLCGAPRKMFSPSHLKALQHPLQVFSVKSPSSSLSSMKLKSLIHTLIVSQMCRIIRALSKVKTIIVEILKENQPIQSLYPYKKKHNSKKHRKVFLGSFRFHYNWCSSSSHIMPVPARVYEGLLPAGSTHLYYDSTWNTIINPSDHQQHGEDCPDSQLAGYLQWLEEKVDEKGSTDEKETNEIDVLAEMFIANSHEKFMLEKQESDRRFQEMLARSM